VSTGAANTDSRPLSWLRTAAGILAMLVGAAIALLVAYAGIALGQNQIAVGFTLTLLCADLSSFLGKPFVRTPGPSVAHWSIPLLVEVPVLGRALFDQNLLVYGSYLALAIVWFWTARTRAGLALRAVGERPEAAHARGIPVNRLRYMYTGIGGALVGLAGASYSLSVKLGWSHRHTAGVGWIALAIVIFGGWHPLRVALGAYLFGALRALGGILQPIFPNLPTQVFQVAPFALMIVALLVVSGQEPDAITGAEGGPRSRVRSLVRRALSGRPPAGLGKRFEAS